MEIFFLPEHSKILISSIYNQMVEEGQNEVYKVWKGRYKKFNYCISQDFIYDHRDYYSIPGLCYDDEHSEEGFLTPVYFTKKVLLYFLHDPDYYVNLASETYGDFQYKDLWAIPFGINRTGKDCVLAWGLKYRR